MPTSSWAAGGILTPAHLFRLSIFYIITMLNPPYLYWSEAFRLSKNQSAHVKDTTNHWSLCTTSGIWLGAFYTVVTQFLWAGDSE